MRCSRSAFSLLSIAGLVAASFLFTACSSGGGDGGGDEYDNSKLSGAYAYVSLGNSGGIGVEVGAITFDGWGNGVYSATTQSASGSITYTVTTDDTITIHDPVIGTSIVGTLRSDGSFFVGTDTRNGSETIIAAVKKSAQITDAAANYFSGRFSHNVQSSADIIQVDMADPVQGELTQTGLYPASNPSTTTSYTLLTDGTLSLPAIGPSRFGAVTSDRQLMILGDGESIDSPEILALCGFKLPGSGMTVASLTGSYLLYQFMDKNVGVGVFATNRGILTFNGAGGGTYFQTANSTGAIEPSRNITYTVDSDGTFVLDGILQGVVIQDGSVLGLVDYDSADNSVGILVGVKY